MSHTVHQLLPILFMFGFAFLLAPLVGATMWIAFDGDRGDRPRDERRGADAAAAPSAPRTSSTRHAA